MNADLTQLNHSIIQIMKSQNQTQQQTVRAIDETARATTEFNSDLFLHKLHVF